MKIAKLITMQFADLDRVFATLQDNIKRILDLLCDSPLARVNIVTANFPNSQNATLHGDGTTGYDLLVAHGTGLRTPRFFPTTVAQLAVTPGFTTADMTKAIINVSPDNATKNQTPQTSILLTCNQPSVQAQLVFF